MPVSSPVRPSASTAGAAAAPAHPWTTARVGVVCDYVEEGWPSMDLVGDLLLEALGRADGFKGSRLRPRMRRPAGSLPFAGASRTALNADRLLNRHLLYPRWLRKRRRGFDLFHVADHSYAQLVHALPAGRAVVTCHDTDAFRSLVDPEREPRPAAFRAMQRRVLRGLRAAARVVCDSAAVRDELVAHALVPPERLRVVPLPAHPDFSPHPDPAADAEAARLLGPARPDGILLLHVGSTVARKRIDVLLDAFAAVRRARPDARLVRAGGTLTREQEGRVDALGLRGAIVSLPPLERPVLAAIYRRAAAVLVPSEREGFGLPLAEALASGVPVAASGIPVLREVGGAAAAYAPPGDADALAAAVLTLLDERDDPARWETRRRRIAERAARFTLAAFAREMAEVYHEVLDGL